jgi:signal transduction histidine kinase
MDNAIKYGDGTGIFLKMEKNDEGHFITVANNGKPLPDSEISYVFNSLWRGSNSKNMRGSGVGLYEARVIARALGGDIRMRTGENRTEVVLFLP